MSAPYDDSAQKEWKERKGKIEGFYREMGQVGTSGKEKVSSIIVGKSGDKLVIQFEEGDGILELVFKLEDEKSNGTTVNVL